MKPADEPRPVEKITHFALVDVEEARLDELSDLAIGKAMGGQIGDALAEKARHNLEVLDDGR